MRRLVSEPLHLGDGRDRLPRPGRRLGAASDRPNWSVAFRGLAVHQPGESHAMIGEPRRVFLCAPACLATALGLAPGDRGPRVGQDGPVTAKVCKTATPNNSREL